MRSAAERRLDRLFLFCHGVGFSMSVTINICQDAVRDRAAAGAVSIGQGAAEACLDIWRYVHCYGQLPYTSKALSVVCLS